MMETFYKQVWKLTLLSRKGPFIILGGNQICTYRDVYDSSKYFGLVLMLLFLYNAANQITMLSSNLPIPIDRMPLIDKSVAPGSVLCDVVAYLAKLLWPCLTSSNWEQ